MTAEGGAGLVSARDFVYGSKSEVGCTTFWEDDDDDDDDDDVKRRRMTVMVEVMVMIMLTTMWMI